MKLGRTMLYNIGVFVALLAFVLFVAVGTSYAAPGLRSGKNSNVMSPGVMNAALQRANGLKEQVDQSKSSTEQEAEDETDIDCETPTEETEDDDASETKGNKDKDKDKDKDKKDTNSDKKDATDDSLPAEAEAEEDDTSNPKTKAHKEKKDKLEEDARGDSPTADNIAKQEARRASKNTAQETGAEHIFYPYRYSRSLAGKVKDGSEKSKQSDKLSFSAKPFSIYIGEDLKYNDEFKHMLSEALSRAIDRGGNNADTDTMPAALSKILENPTGEQKKTLKTKAALLADLDRIKKHSDSPELFENVIDEVAQMTAISLVGQENLPGIIGKEDIASVIALYGKFDGAIEDTMLKYKMGVADYYNAVKEDIASNFTILQVKNILSKNMIKEELDKLPPSQIDKILKRIKMVEQKNKTLAEEYILQQEAKYRADYIERTEKLVEKDVIRALEDFCHKFHSILNATTH